MKSLIYGYGITGKSFEKYLIRNNIEYDIYDDDKSLYISDRFTSELNQNWNVIYCSPGITKKNIQKLKSLKYKFIKTDIEIFCSENSSIKIGVTGTNRKSTTCFHLFQLLSKKFKVNLIGNIGEPVLNHLKDVADYSIIELSSQQLDKLESIELDYGVLLNIAPDHIDYHGSFEEYKRVKKRILEAQKSSFENDPFELYKWITGEEAEAMDLSDLPFRFQMISKSIINDSKSTNMHSLEYAIEKANKYFKNSSYHLIVCGNPEKEGYRKFSAKGPKNIFIIGKHALDIDKCIDHRNKFIFNNLNEALLKISNETSQNILFSPGFPSGNDFKNFEDRGIFFNESVKKILSNDI